MAQLLPYITDGLRASGPGDFRLATYMIVMRLVSVAVPAPQLRDGVAFWQTHVALQLCCGLVLMMSLIAPEGLRPEDGEAQQFVFPEAPYCVVPAQTASNVNNTHLVLARRC